MKFWQKRGNQKGDTIVEVLIAIAIISSVLAGAFLVTQKSTVAVRSSQEQAEMLQILQAQVELVRTKTLTEADTSGGIYKTTPKYFCIDNDASSGTYNTRVDSPGLTDLDNFGTYAAACANIDNRYHIAVTYDDTSKTFTFYGRWDLIQGGRGEVQLSYRVYPGAIGLAYPPGVTPGAPGDPDDATADVTTAPCTMAAGVCVPEAGPPRYRWDSYFQNKTLNVGTTVLSCLWSFSDGTTDNGSCNYLDIEHHNWVDAPNPTDFPALCGNTNPIYDRTVILKVNLANGLTASKEYKTHLPRCIFTP